MAAPPKYVPSISQQRSLPSKNANVPMHPRKVRGGARIPTGDIAGPAAWAAHRWLRVLEASALGGVSGGALAEGFHYAREGQTKRWSVGGGLIEASIQGRAIRAYTTRLLFDVFPHDAWEKVTAALSEGSSYAAKLLAGELPASIEDVFAPHGLQLVPTDATRIRTSCTCTDEPEHSDAPRPKSDAVAPHAAQPQAPWCKHVCCLAYLFASKLALEPFVIFSIRGLDAHEILERVRQRRTLTGSVGGSTAVYTQSVPGVSDTTFPSLEDSIDSFWEPATGVAMLELPMDKPLLSHPLLRRLGPSPWAALRVVTSQASQAPPQRSATRSPVQPLEPSLPTPPPTQTPPQFPLVGLLASCYDTMSEDSLSKSRRAADAEGGGHSAGDAITEARMLDSDGRAEDADL